MPKQTLIAEEIEIEDILEESLRESSGLTEWTRSETLALAQQSCTLCYGLGLRAGRGGASVPCQCVFRAIFRACYRRFRHCVSKEKYVSKVSLETNPGRQRRSTWGLKNEEFVADFCLVSRRTLSPIEHQIFRFHYLLGADWKICCMKLKLERGAFFHEVYRIEEKLGRVFRELRPHPLFPVDEYFNSTGRYDKRPSILAMFPVEDGDCGFMEEMVETEVVPKRKKKSKKVLKFPIKFAA